ncbi:hypothetical protein K502DRAFT_199436 [Neoconidiobolus thromboides FSU 785]|nr:hypothetical protein K502DRAFT_199436 [Neoconidiobolus thromboides FSU 785]
MEESYTFPSDDKAKLFSFLNCGINSVLVYSKILDASDYDKLKGGNLSIPQNFGNEHEEYVQSSIQKALELFSEKKLHQIDLNIMSKRNHDVIGKWCFNISYKNGLNGQNHADDENKFENDLKMLERRISSSISMLYNCGEKYYEIVLIVHQDLKIEKEWKETYPGLINTSLNELLLRELNEESFNLKSKAQFNKKF